MMEPADWKEFVRQWGVEGMPRDKIRLSTAAWNAALFHVGYSLMLKSEELNLSDEQVEAICNLECFHPVREARPEGLIT